MVSQPVTLDNNVWVPFAEFPISKQAKKVLRDIIEPVLEILENFGVHHKEYYTSVSNLSSI